MLGKWAVRGGRHADIHGIRLKAGAAWGGVQHSKPEFPNMMRNPKSRRKQTTYIIQLDHSENFIVQIRALLCSCATPQRIAPFYSSSDNLSSLLEGECSSDMGFSSFS